jgi:spermidine synthase
MHDNDFEIIERCKTPRGEVQLQRRGTEYEIISNGTFLMATYYGGSEKLLVKAALDACESYMCSVLIGGLGVGYSLAEAVGNTRTQQVTVIEIEEKIIDWNRSYLVGFSGNAMDNKKTKIIHADLIQWMSQTQETFDVICWILITVLNGQFFRRIKVYTTKKD